MPYQDFFYTFNDLPKSATSEEINRACSSSLRRKHAFEYFYAKNPTDVRYLTGYLLDYGAIYDDEMFTHCLDLIEIGLKLDDQQNCHQQLLNMRENIRREQHERHLELGPDEPQDPNSLRYQFRSGNYDPIIRRFEELRASIVPRGILGTPDEKELWHLYELTIQISAVNSEMENAKARLEEYESKRIAVKLSPLPNYTLQETILGWLASKDIKLAIEQLEFWLEHSQIPSVSEMIKDHPKFCHLFVDS